MSPRGRLLLPLLSVLGASALAFALLPRATSANQTAPIVKVHARDRAAPVAISAGTIAPVPTRFEQLRALHVENATTRESRNLKLYDAAGQIDETCAKQLDELLCDARDPKNPAITRLNRRTLQLLFKAAYHFRSYEVEVVSAYRKPARRREGPHGTGAAIDFRLRGVPAASLASYLRDIPRTGVGIYTHPKTHYVHLDSRDHSFHWLDASPPGRRWREKSIGQPGLEKRDALYSREGDWP
jgi:uncharacterized protein YcbK (DUF882 family)